MIYVYFTLFCFVVGEYFDVPFAKTLDPVAGNAEGEGSSPIFEMGKRTA